MKKTILLAMSLVSTMMFAQNFEGVVNYSFNVDAGEQTAQLQSSMPTSMMISMKGQDSRVDMKGGMVGMMMGGVITKGEEKKVYTLMPSMNTAYYTVIDESVEEKANDVKVVNTKIKKKIAGYDCVKYEVTSSTPQGDQTVIIWTTKDVDIKPNSNSGMLASAKNVDGFPIRVEMSIPLGDGTNGLITLEVDKIEKKALDASLFTIPEGYNVDTMENMMGGGGF